MIPTPGQGKNDDEVNEIEKVQEEPDKDEKTDSGLSTDAFGILEYENVKGAKKGCIRYEFSP